MRTKLQIFKVVAKHLSFTKAAEQLYLSQPAVSKAIKSLEEEFKTTLFVRKRNAIELTAEGKAFLIHTQKILSIYAEMDEQFTHKNEAFPETIDMGVSTTLSDYVIPQVIAQYNLRFPKTKFSIRAANTEYIEKLILEEEIHFGITEGNTNNNKLSYTKFLKDEIVLVTNATNTSIKENAIALKKLKDLPLVSRESGSGTREVIDSFLQQHQIKSIDRNILFNSTEAIKNFLYHSEHFALLSIHSVADDLKNNRLKIIDIKNFSIERWFYFVRRTGYLSKNIDYLERFIQKRNNF
ncbi:LysR family transcriptional regulator [Leeuwenhoekiella sp. ZYFB001]|uniref:LysR family transcriptional regulator n=1 Tax=Leeuwenhoekiella sp. ZYFB001 TaxID=2719912 RepID=UPI0014312D4B|nr:LysR family transcriptional regulator [Leeuwenhoekiella sp. ZYFB001]